MNVREQLLTVYYVVGRCMEETAKHRTLSHPYSQCNLQYVSTEVE